MPAHIPSASAGMEFMCGIAPAASMEQRQLTWRSFAQLGAGSGIQGAPFAQGTALLQVHTFQGQLLSPLQAVLAAAVRSTGVLQPTP